MIDLALRLKITIGKEYAPELKTVIKDIYPKKVKIKDSKITGG